MNIDVCSADAILQAAAQMQIDLGLSHGEAARRAWDLAVEVEKLCQGKAKEIMPAQLCQCDYCTAARAVVQEDDGL